MNMLNLPPETIFEILSWAHWRDVLRIRQTCKWLLAITCSKALWSNIIKNHNHSLSSEFICCQSTMPVLPSILNKPGEYYTSEELERIFRRARVAERVWKLGLRLKNEVIPPQNHKNILPMNEYDTFIRHLHILRNGRWGIFFSDALISMSYCDMDQELFQPIPFELAPTSIPLSPSDFPKLIAIDEDHFNPLLSCHILIPFLMETSISISRFEVWHVTLVVDDFGKEAGLRANREMRILVPFLQSYHLDQYFLKSTSLSRDRIACVLDTHRSTYCVILIFDWRGRHGENNEEAQVDSWRIIMNPRGSLVSRHGRTEGSIQLIPNDRIIVTEGSTLKIFDYSNLKIFTIKNFNLNLDSPDPEYTPKPIWEMGLPLYYGQIRISDVFHVEDKTYGKLIRLVFLNAEEIGGLTIFPPLSFDDGGSNKENTRRMVVMKQRLMNIRDTTTVFNEKMAFIGYEFGVGWRENRQSFVLLSYKWVDESIVELQSHSHQNFSGVEPGCPQSREVKIRCGCARNNSTIGRIYVGLAAGRIVTINMRHGICITDLVDSDTIHK